MWFVHKVKKHINSLLLISIWILSISLFFLILYFPGYSNVSIENVWYKLSLYIVVAVGFAAFTVWTYLFIVGVSVRVLNLYKNTKFILEDTAYFLMLLIVLVIGYFFGRVETIVKIDSEKKEQPAIIKTIYIKPTMNPTPTVAPKKSIESIIVQVTPTPPLPEEPGEWGVAKQIGEHTWTMKIGRDDKMTTPLEVFDALNNYRQKHGKPTLTWDNRLAEYAQQRAKYFTSIGQTDAHKGFIEYVNDVENIKKLGFWSVGENSSSGYQLTGVHLIEWIYAGDKPHDDNQLSADWSHVGIGVDTAQTDLIFGGRSM